MTPPWGMCRACVKARAVVTWPTDGMRLCAECAEGAAHEALAVPGVRDSEIAAVAAACARVIADWSDRDHVVTVGMAGVSDEAWPRFRTALAFHGLTVEWDAVEGAAEVFDVDAIVRWAARMCAAAEARSAAERMVS